MLKPTLNPFLKLRTASRREKRNFWLKLLFLSGILGLGILPELFNPNPAQSAEKLVVQYGLIDLSLSLNSLQKFADTGEIDSELKFYSRLAGQSKIAQLRPLLQKRYTVNPWIVSAMMYSPIGEDFLKGIGHYIQTESGLNGFYAIRAAVILAAAQPNGFTVLDILQQYPTQDIRLEAKNLLALQQKIETLVNYKEAALTAIAKAAQAEAQNAPLTHKFANLSQPGRYPVTTHQLQLERSMQRLDGSNVSRPYKVALFLPSQKTEPAPIVIISHGLGSSIGGFTYLAQHLASHGFAVAIPEHLGSGEAIKKAFLLGVIDTNVAPQDFVERPLDIRQTLDELERLSNTDPALKGKLNLQQVGVWGHSLGGYTALVLGGATLNQARIHQNCQPDQPRGNPSIFLQCLSQVLPHEKQNLSDPRVKAVFAVNPITSVVLGAEGMGSLKVPTFLVSSSQDILATLVEEQIHPFLWLKTPEKYLAVLNSSGHLAADAGDGVNSTSERSGFAKQVQEILAGADSALTRQYLKALSLAFMQTYIGNQPEYQAALSAAYAESISQPPVKLEIVRSLTPEDLIQAYGSQPPVPIFPVTN